MIIYYRHKSKPDKKLVHNTCKVLKNNPFLKMTLEELNEFTLKRLEEDKKTGIILHYSVEVK